MFHVRNYKNSEKSFYFSILIFKNDIDMTQNFLAFCEKLMYEKNNAFTSNYELQHFQVNFYQVATTFFFYSNFLTIILIIKLSKTLL